MAESRAQSLWRFVAMLFGLISERSIWYPINLLAAGILHSLGRGARRATAAIQADPGLIAGNVHSRDDLDFGGNALRHLASNVSAWLPLGASGLVTPVLWSGLRRRHARLHQSHS